MNPVDWSPGASLEMLKLRARMLQNMRAFFERLEVLEVDTPALSVAAVPDPHVESFQVQDNGPGSASFRYLHTSPEFPMKRLLAAASGPIYQICKVFRQGEIGARHNPEFTLLEWYRPGIDHMALMEEVEALLRYLLAGVKSLPPAQWLSYREVFLEYVGIDPLTSDVRELRHCAIEHGIEPPEGLFEKDAWLDLLLTHTIEAKLPEFTFIYDYPASQASLAKIRQSDFPVAERFEVYLNGIELANGFHELTDAQEQRHRFEQENLSRRAAGLETVHLDQSFLAALEAGMPPSAGVALGVDRLLMYATDADSLDQVMAFSHPRA